MKNNVTRIHRIGQLSESLEDYLEIIYNLVQKQRVARVRDIAKAKAVKMSSVTSALKRLDREGLANYKAREFVELTRAGSNLAKRLIKRHNFLTKFLIEVLQVNPVTAESDACSMEHVLSPQTMNRFFDFSEFLQSQARGVKNIAEKFKRSYINHNDNI
jgi:DtxR family Mn-dependent transcriptional regulator